MYVSRRGDRTENKPVMAHLVSFVSFCLEEYKCISNYILADELGVRSFSDSTFLWESCKNWLILLPCTKLANGLVLDLNRNCLFFSPECGLCEDKARKDGKERKVRKTDDWKNNNVERKIEKNKRIKEGWKKGRKKEDRDAEL